MIAASCSAAATAAAAARSAASSSAAAESVGFMGLGAMGYPIAGRLAPVVRAASSGGGNELKVWNRTRERSALHAQEFGSRAVEHVEDLASCRVVFSCVSTTREVEALAEPLARGVSSSSALGAAPRAPLVWVDCTSGDPDRTRNLAARLRPKGIHLFDCPLSGGWRGARDGTLAGMLGGEDADHSVAMHLLRAFTAKVQPCGGTGAGMAVKAVNNALNSAHLLLGAEALLTLRRLGACPAAALEVINASPGRSLQTQVRLPEEALTRRFGYGFKLGLMKKDCDTAADFLPSSALLTRACEAVAAATEARGMEADYSELAAWLEDKAGVTLEGPVPGLGLGGGLGGGGGDGAVRAVAAALAAAQLLMAAEGMLALRRLGMDPAQALSVINRASGRSFQTEAVLPQEVLTRRFAHGLGMGLVGEACGVTERLLRENFPEAPLLRLACQTAVSAAASLGSAADLSELARWLEAKACLEIRPPAAAAEARLGAAPEVRGEVSRLSGPTFC